MNVLNNIKDFFDKYKTKNPNRGCSDFFANCLKYQKYIFLFKKFSN